MNAIEIVEQADALVPGNTVPFKTKLLFINQTANEAYRDYALPEAVYPFTTSSGLALYPLPDDCPEDTIRELVVGSVPVNYGSLTDGGEIAQNEPFYSIIDGVLFINPVPGDVKNAFLYYRPRILQYTVTNIKTQTNFPSDFVRLLVLGCAVAVAKTRPDTLKLADRYEIDFRMLAEKAERKLTKKKPTRVNVTRPWL